MTKKLQTLCCCSRIGQFVSKCENFTILQHIFKNRQDFAVTLRVHYHRAITALASMDDSGSWPTPMKRAAFAQMHVQCSRTVNNVHVNEVAF
jgi:hypothetical protein